MCGVCVQSCTCKEAVLNLCISSVQVTISSLKRRFMWGMFLLCCRRVHSISSWRVEESQSCENDLRQRRWHSAGPSWCICTAECFRVCKMFGDWRREPQCVAGVWRWELHIQAECKEVRTCLSYAITMLRMRCAWGKCKDIVEKLMATNQNSRSPVW